MQYTIFAVCERTFTLTFQGVSKLGIPRILAAIYVLDYSTIFWFTRPEYLGYVVNPFPSLNLTSFIITSLLKTTSSYKMKLMYHILEYLWNNTSRTLLQYPFLFFHFKLNFLEWEKTKNGNSFGLKKNSSIIFQANRFFHFLLLKSR